MLTVYWLEFSTSTNLILSYLDKYVIDSTRAFLEYVVDMIRRKIVLITQKNTQLARSRCDLFFRNLERAIKSFHPIIPNIIRNGRIGRINLSCLFGNTEWNTKNTMVGKKIIRYFFHLNVLKNPKRMKKLTGGIRIPRTSNR